MEKRSQFINKCLVPLESKKKKKIFTVALSDTNDLMAIFLFTNKGF